MTNQERMGLLKTVFGLIFQSKLANTDITTVKVQTNTGVWAGRWFKDSSTGQQTLRGFDFTCNLGDRIISLRCLEQNPNKMDNFGNLKKFALLAREGHQIMWVIDRNGSFLGHLFDGDWKPSWQPATTPAVRQQPAQQNTYNSPASQTEIPDEVQGNAEYVIPEDLPDIPDNVEVPDYILEEIAADENPPEWEG